MRDESQNLTLDLTQQSIAFGDNGRGARASSLAEHINSHFDIDGSGAIGFMVNDPADIRQFTKPMICQRHSRTSVKGLYDGEGQRSEASMGFGEAISAGFSNYFNFKGRSTRSAFWYFVLFLVILEAVTGILDVALFGLQTVGRISSIAGLATLIPSISVFVRRLHDISRTGWWLLLALIPIIGWIILIVWACQPTIPQANEYGPPPAA